MRLVVSDVRRETSGPQSQMDLNLAQRMPELARYLVACFPSLSRFDVLVTRDGPARTLEVTYAFDGSNIVRAFQTPIQPPGEGRELLAAFARLAEDLHHALGSAADDAPVQRSRLG